MESFVECNTNCNVTFCVSVVKKLYIHFMVCMVKSRHLDLNILGHFNQQFFELYEHHLEFIIGVHFVTTMLAGIVFCKTRTNRAPRYHWVHDL